MRFLVEDEPVYPGQSPRICKRLHIKPEKVSLKLYFR
jgi:hypothetical protein